MTATVPGWLSQQRPGLFGFEVSRPDTIPISRPDVAPPDPLPFDPAVNPAYNPDESLLFEPKMSPVIDWQLHHPAIVPGSLGSKELSPPKPRDFVGRMAMGLGMLLDFQKVVFVRVDGLGTPDKPKPTLASSAKWQLKKSPTVVPNEAGQLEDIQYLCGFLSNEGVDLHHTMTCLNIESFYSRPSKYSIQKSFKGPFQYSQGAMNRAVGGSPVTYDLFDLETQAFCFARDYFDFTKMLKKAFGPDFEVQPWMLYFMHQQGPAGAIGFIKGSLVNPNESLWNNTRRRSIKWKNITGQATALLAGNNPRNISVANYCTLFETFYAKHNDGRIRQPVTAYIEQPTIQVASNSPSIPTGLVRVAPTDLFLPASGGSIFGLDRLTPGVGLDLRGLDSPGQQKYVFWSNSLTQLLMSPGMLFIMEFANWGRSLVPIGPNNVAKFFDARDQAVGGSERRLQILQAKGPGIGPPDSGTAGYDDPTYGEPKQEIYIRDQRTDGAGGAHITIEGNPGTQEFSTTDFDYWYQTTSDTWSRIAVYRWNPPAGVEENYPNLTYEQTHNIGGPLWEGSLPWGPSSRFVGNQDESDYYKGRSVPENAITEEYPIHQDGIGVPYGYVRIAWRRINEQLGISINGIAARITPMLLDISDLSNDLFGVSQGQFVITRILGFPDDQNDVALEVASNPETEIGTELV